MQRPPPCLLLSLSLPVRRPTQDEPCSFDLLVYTSADTSVPKAWEESDPRYITPGESAEVKLRSITTSIHKVAPTVSYRSTTG